LTVADAAVQGRRVRELAERIIPHLGKGWQIPTASGVALEGPRDERIWLSHIRTSDGTHLLQITPATPGGRVGDTATIGLFTLPSQIADLIRTEVLPELRRRLDRARAADTRRRAEEQARRGHAQAVADRLGADWAVHEDTYSVRVERPKKKARIFGNINWSRKDGSMYLDLHNLPAELVEHLVDGIEAHMSRHEIDGQAALRKRPKRLNYLLELMVAAGYRIDKLEREHEALFGKPMFNMDLRAAPGDDLVSYVLERQDRLDRAIRVLETRLE
jgi:hypothetical protein